MNIPIVFTDSYLPALHCSIGGALQLTHRQKYKCEVFAFSAEYWANEESETGRFAIAQRVAREAWDSIPANQVVIYTEVYRFTEPEYPSGTTALITNIGQMRRYDARRGVLYASSWRDWSEGEVDLAYADVTELWVVERFISHVA